MNKNPGIIGKKIGMTQIFDDKGEVIRCTVVQSGAIVIGKRTQEKDGYDALVVGLGERKEKHTSKPLAGGYKKSGQTPKRIVRELRSTAEYVASFELGLCDARKIFADDVGVLFGIGTQLMEINLLVEVGVFRCALVALGIARVIKARAVGLPSDAAAAGGEIHARHDV